ncbi:uncharacterized protein [Prorops nasuta]|uniref:uncharacterized protein n=1 Tax=Prorops nasuta TaxID=863751 RepID=UPI0034CE8190
MIRFIRGAFMFCFNIVAILEIRKLIIIRNNMDLLIESFPQMVLLNSAISAISYYIQSDTAAYLIDSYVEDLNAMLRDDAESIEIKENNIEAAQFFGNCFAAYGICVFCPFLVITRFNIVFLRNETAFAEHPWFKENSDSNLLNQCLVFAIKTSINVFSTVLIVANYLLTIIFVFHVTGTIEIIIYKLGKLSTFKDFEMARLFIINDIIQKHQKILRFGKLFMNYMLVSQIQLIIASLLMLSSTMVQLSNTEVILLLHILLILGGSCNLCQRVIDAIETLSDHILASEWYKCPIEYQKLLYIMLEQTSHPTIFQSAKPLTLSHEIFSAAIRISLSYCMFLRSVR